jgi:phosphatidylglycerophosphatase GEP4
MGQRIVFLIILWFQFHLTRSLVSPFFLSQSFNLIGFKSFFSSLQKPELFLPDATVVDVTMIDLKKLKKLGIQGLIFDKDNTLTKPYQHTLQPKVQQFLQNANKVEI